MTSEVVFVDGEPRVVFSGVSREELFVLVDSVIEWRVECERRLVEDLVGEPRAVHEVYEKYLRDLSVVQGGLWDAYWGLVEVG